MADQKRWFKLWCSAPADDDLQALPPADRWAWAALGCYTKEHGNRGRVVVSATNRVLAAQMGVEPGAITATILRLPHVQLVESKTDNGKVTVTWDNWLKYQEDRTIYERVKRLRSKKRGEEKRDSSPVPDSRKNPSQEKTDASIAADLPPAWPSPEALLGLYNAEAADELPEATVLSPERRRRAAALLKAFPDRDWWLETFRSTKASRFLRGLAAPRNGHKAFRPSFDWFLGKGQDGVENALKVYEGRYTD